ncbi:Uncharacterised protein [Serratia fonticola]|uniref:Uncharacterized protein n=1 Tax=Serratia fonticola TaxID=47917 RepID=A0A4U9U8U5_SERFO|nr:Uncharacterised protein [Serratia fonticola]
MCSTKKSMIIVGAGIIGALNRLSFGQPWNKSDRYRPSASQLSGATGSAFGWIHTTGE